MSHRIARRLGLLSLALGFAACGGSGGGGPVVVVLSDGIRNYMTKFVEPKWMKQHGFE